MKILRFGSYCYPEEVSSSHLSRNTNEAYRDAGFVTENYVPTPTRGIDKETRRKYKKIKYEEIYDGSFHIYRFSMFRERKNPVLRAIRYILVNIKQYFKGIKAKKIDLILGSSTPPTQGMLCALVKKKLSKKYQKNVPFIYNLQDIFPDSLVHTGLTKKGSVLWKLGRKIENYTYNSADKIVVISESFKQNIMEKGVPEEKICIIENWIDTEEVVNIPREENKLFKKYNLDRNKFYICYSGNIGHTQNLDMLLDTAKRIAEANSDIYFIIIGEGAAKSHIALRIEAEKITNVIMLPFQDYTDISHVFSLGDLGLIISKKGIGTNSVPSKTWSIMSAARPVLASFDKGGDLDRIITKNNCGICISPDNTEAFYNTILSCYANSDKLYEMGKNGRNYVTTYLTKEIGTKKWIELLKSIVAKGKATFDNQKQIEREKETVEA
ncbi:MAG: glycosyltransferase family 4 protein [Clostridia bacterium]|nr:glycosyltransferase family 4 protein [Clostridia bacterium]